MGVAVALILIILIALIVYYLYQESQYKQLTADVLRKLGLSSWMFFDPVDSSVRLKSSKAVNEYTAIKYFKEDRERIDSVYNKLKSKLAYAYKLTSFLNHNEFENRPTYPRLKKYIQSHLDSLYAYRLVVWYQSPAGNSTNRKTILINKEFIEGVISDPSLTMSKSEYNKYLKEQSQEQLDKKQHDYYERVNRIIDLANDNKNKLVSKDDQNELDRLISSLFDKTVNSIKKIKSPDSEEWDVINRIVVNVGQDVTKIVNKNKQIIEYYNSPEFKKIKDTCESLMSSQKEFNEYINEKAQSISTLFGTRIVRNETIVDDKYNYIRPYKKSITPFTAEVSSTVFSSAENNPIDYIIKYFYPNKSIYPEQIRKLQTLVEELETLKDARQIIDNYKKDYQQYISDVPAFIMENDEEGFYARLGFASISEEALTVEYKFAYTSDGGMAQRSFSIPMSEETIVELINTLQNGLSMSAFAKEQRALMTSKLRQHIKERDNYTCRVCHNSTFNEPNLLLEIDHIVPVSKGGATVEDNLQTLCWKCNRAKSNKLFA